MKPKIHLLKGPDLEKLPAAHQKLRQKINELVTRLLDRETTGGDGDFQVAISDETTAIATSATARTFRMPWAMTLQDLRLSLITAQTSGTAVTVTVSQNGTTILSTSLTIDNTEKTSLTAAVPVVISNTALLDDAIIVIGVTVGDGTAIGGKVTFKGVK